MKKYIFSGIFIALCTLCLMSCSIFAQSDAGPQGSSNKLHVTPVVPLSHTPTPITEPKTAILSIPAVAGYYQAIKVRNYNLAYSYLTDNASTTSGQKLTEEAFVQLALEADKESGPVTSVLINPSSPDSTSMTMTIDRGPNLEYHTHLTLTKEGKYWKIVSLDRI